MKQNIIMYIANIFMAIKTQKDKTLYIVYIEQISLWLITKQNDTEDLYNIYELRPHEYKLTMIYT